MTAFLSAVMVLANGPAAMSAASCACALFSAASAWLIWRLAVAEAIGALFWAWASCCWACWIETAAAARSTAESPPLSVASFALATARFAFAMASAEVTELESATARTWPCLTLSPTATLTVFTNHVLLPPPLLAELDELDVLDEASCGWLPKARP